MDPEEREGWAIEFDVFGRVYAWDGGGDDGEDGGCGEREEGEGGGGHRTAVYVT